MTALDTPPAPAQRPCFISFSPAEDGVGNAVISPQEPVDGPYLTLIGGGDNAEQNRLAQAICDRFNTTPPATAPEGPTAASAAKLLRPFLVDDCGCSPRCRCDEEGALRIWKENARDAIRTALAAIAAMPAPPPSAEVEEMAGKYDTEKLVDGLLKHEWTGHGKRGVATGDDYMVDGTDAVHAAAALLRRLAGERDEWRSRADSAEMRWGWHFNARATAAETRVKELEKALRELRSYAASVWFDEADASDEERQIMDRARATLAGGTHEP